MKNRPQEADVDFIRALAELLRDNDLTEIEVERSYGADDGLVVRVAREIMAAPAPAPVATAMATAPAPAQQAEPAQAASKPASGDPAEHPGMIPSPMVGTVYMQSEPGAPAFIRVGDTVDEGQTLLIIEAMKTMNQIPAPRAGKVARILVDDGSPVEFGAPLIILE
ncbi:acetyl-CoA carboxylase biotin carboxyl carrier protein [Amaricoccus macauensis]|uniref:acetyl-CoA carboxylase biotin carboxyl carrier protein n=1 Tax=Amaricoccus macauensis TaxID=57001 RepID=UPI003C7DC63A